MKLLFFLNAFLSVSDYGSDGFQHEINCDRGTSDCRDSGLYKVMLKPYVLQILNSKAMGALKKNELLLQLALSVYQSKSSLLGKIANYASTYF